MNDIVSVCVAVTSEWFLPLLAIGLLCLVSLQRPWALWRWIEARDDRVPVLVLTILSVLALVLGRAALRHWDALLTFTLPSPRSLAPGDMLAFLLSFLERGLLGPVEARGHMQGVLVLGSLASATGVMLYRFSRSAFTMRIEQLYDRPPRRIVVMGLSQLPDTPATKAAIEAAQGLDLERAIRADLGRLPWQQNLRVLHHHLARPLPEAPFWTRRLTGRRKRPETRLVVVLPSRESKPQTGAFKALALDCLDRSGIAAPRFEVWHQPADYDDLQSLRSALLSIIRSVRERADIEAGLDEISIDTTAGMKLFSIAGAAVTFASPLEFTYVETEGKNRVVVFDVRAEFRRPQRA